MSDPVPEDVTTMFGWLHYWLGPIGAGAGVVLPALTFGLGLFWRAALSRGHTEAYAEQMRHLQADQVALRQEIVDLRVIVAAVPRREEIESLRKSLEDNFASLNRRLDSFVQEIRS